MAPQTRSRLSRKLHIAVLAGGNSAERVISLKSGAAVARALTELDHAICEVDPAVVALHGKFGEDGQVQQILEDAGVPYTGSGIAASRLAFSKSAAKERFVQNGV